MTRLVLLLTAPFQISSTFAIDNLRNEFANPRDEARMKLWWFHGETIDTEEGIDADLKAFKDAGVGG